MGYKNSKANANIMLIPQQEKTLFLCVLLLLSPIAIAKDKTKDSEKSPIKVQVSGASDALAQNLKVFLPSLRNLKCDSTKRRVERFIDASNQKLLEGAEAMGYFNGKFSMDSRRERNCWVLSIDAKPGTTVKVEQITIELNGDGRKLDIFKALLTKPPYQVGDVFISQAYDDFKSQLKKTATRLGFFDARFEKRSIRVDPDKNTARIELVFNTGVRYRLGKVTIEQDVLDTRHRNHYIRLRQGNVFDSTQLIQQQRLLESSKYYKNVEVRAAYKQAKDGTIPISITAPRRKRYTYQGGIGFATDDGVYFDLGMDVHWLNQKGHKFNLTARFAEKDPAFGAVYTVPLAEPENKYATLSASWKESDNNDIRGTALELGFAYHRRSDNDWEQVGSLSYLDEKTEIDANDTTNSELFLFGLSTSKTVRDDPLFPNKGWRVSLAAKAALEEAVSDQTLFQLELKGKYLYTFNKDVDKKSDNNKREPDNAGKIILNAEIGRTFSDEFNEIPKSLRFFAGGQNSVRGYSFESLGERDDEDNVVGGKQKLIANVEYEYPIAAIDNLSAAIFVDTGNAFNDFNDFSLKTGYGLGVRYKSPLGPIRIDLAVPEDDGSDINLYFSLGPDL